MKKICFQIFLLFLAQNLTYLAYLYFFINILMIIDVLMNNILFIKITHLAYNEI